MYLKGVSMGLRGPFLVDIEEHYSTSISTMGKGLALGALCRFIASYAGRTTVTAAYLQRPILLYFSWPADVLVLDVARPGALHGVLAAGHLQRADAHRQRLLDALQPHLRVARHRRSHSNGYAYI